MASLRNDMIIRIVKMSFIPEQVDNFVALFNKNKEHIRNFDGCHHLQLLRDIQEPNQFFTYSHWETETHLNNYRNSALFKDIWANTKVKFNQKPEAWSVTEF